MKTITPPQSYILFLSLTLALALSSAVASAQDSNLVRINNQVAAIEVIGQNLDQNFQIYCRIAGQDSLIRIHDTTNWPDSIQTTYNITFDSAGKIVKFLEMPFSETGDWDCEIVHYFDPNGRLIEFAFFYNTFAAGCTPVLHETRVQYFSDTGAPISDTRTYADSSYTSIDTVGCFIDDQFEYKVYRNVSELKASLRF